MRKENFKTVHLYGDILCYETLKCDSGLLCLDWREICDGVQHCLSGRDEENCDLLEMNQCDEDEYRCSNGMWIPEEFFMDGGLDCLDWSDEMFFRSHEQCPEESVSTECDDHLCEQVWWSCGDGQCIHDRLYFQKWNTRFMCISGRDQYFICETHRTGLWWTMPNGRCFNSMLSMSRVMRHSDEDVCEYLLKCALSMGGEIHCHCKGRMECVYRLEEFCPLLLIQYPRGAIVTPVTFFFYNRTRDWQYSWPDWIVINGTVRCRGSLVSARKFVPYTSQLNFRGLLEEYFCRSSENVPVAEQECHHSNESTDRCGDWNGCLSKTRILDGAMACLHGNDEQDQNEMEIAESCARVRRHRFRCSREQATCLEVRSLGNVAKTCRNRFDELLFGVGRLLSSMNCNEQRQDECSLVRQYIEESWKPVKGDGGHSRVRITFRSYCDTFVDIKTGEDEDLLQCQRSWICSEEKLQCQTGQCFDVEWQDDNEWDCPDASDEYSMFRHRTSLVLEKVSRYDLSNRSSLIPSSCPFQSHPFLCLSANVTEQGFSCFNLSQIGDGRIDCLGAFDEQLTTKHCSQSLPTLGPHFRCSSTKSCIPYLVHCWEEEYRCPNRSDDQFWCEREHRPANCFDLTDFVCFDGRCVKEGRCNFHIECLFAEDEYMCDSVSLEYRSIMPYRAMKQSISSQRSAPSTLRFSLYPADACITRLNSSHSLTSKNNSNISSSSSSWPWSSPYRCNRALGVWSSIEMKDDSVACFCPPQYYGTSCELHADRLSVFLSLDLSQSSYVNAYDPQILLKLVVLFIFNGEVLDRDQFHLHPFFQLTETLDQK